VRTIGLLVVCTALWLSSAAQASAQIHVGPQLSLGTDSDFGLGGRIVFPLRVGALGVDGAIDGNYFFGPGTGIDSWIDTNANVRIPIPVARDFTTRLGAGINFTFISIDVPGSPTSTSESEVGLNLLGTIEFSRGHIAPFADVRLIVGGGEQLVLTAGFTIGPRR
jgi:hypothetical protein